MKKYKLLLIFCLALIGKTVFSADGDYTIEELDQFFKEGIINEEEYEILKNEISGYSLIDDNYLYDITLNGSVRSRNFKLTRKDGNLYYPLLDFLSIAGVANYEYSKDEVRILLGDTLQEVKIDYKTNTYSIGDTEYKYQPSELYIEKGEIYISEEIFKKLFTRTFEKKDDIFKIESYLTFKTGQELKDRLDNRNERFQDEDSQNTLFFTNGKSLFDLGYLRANLDWQFVDRNPAVVDFQTSSSTDWNGELEYQGGLLFGEVTASYDLEAQKLEDVSIYYPNIIQGHSLEVGSYGIGSQDRELGFSFRKERGFFDEDGEIVIREQVPIGSRVELLYLGFPIDVKDAENGEVEFINSELRSDRDYQLRVYSPDGKISLIDINTNTSYNQQRKGTFEYDIIGREDAVTDNFLGNANIYYGLTNNLTLGLSYFRENETLFTSPTDTKIETLDYFVGEAILGDEYKDLDYTFVVGKEFIKDNREIEYFESDLSYGPFRFTSENVFYGEQYEEDKSAQYSLEYRPVSYLDVTYNYYIDEFKSQETEHDYDVIVSVNKTLNDMLITGEWTIDRSRNQEYGVNFYYTGNYLMDIRFSNQWQNEGREYTGTLSLVKKQPTEGLLDYSMDFIYSTADETRFGVSFSLELDDWLSFGFDSAHSGNKYSVGIDKIVDLKNITKDIDSMDVSRVKAITYLDANNNNVYDEGEELVPYSKIKIGQDEMVTDEEGVAWIHGVTNDIIYDIDTQIRKPSYSIGENKLKLQGVRAGTIEAYIPVKAKVNFIGNVNLDSSKALTDEEKARVYEQMSVRIKNNDGEHLETLLVEADGSFILSEIYPGKYEAEVVYWGNEYDLPKETIKADIKYLDGEDEVFEVNFNLKK